MERELTYTYTYMHICMYNQLKTQTSKGRQPQVTAEGQEVTASPPEVSRGSSLAVRKGHIKDAM